MNIRMGGHICRNCHCPNVGTACSSTATRRAAWRCFDCSYSWWVFVELGWTIVRLGPGTNGSNAGCSRRSCDRNCSSSCSNEASTEGLASLQSGSRGRWHFSTIRPVKLPADTDAVGERARASPRCGIGPSISPTEGVCDKRRLQVYTK